jgi:hypothetical protein
MITSFKIIKNFKTLLALLFATPEGPYLSISED